MSSRPKDIADLPLEHNANLLPAPRRLARLPPKRRPALAVP